MSFVEDFRRLVSSNRATGYAALVRPLSYEEGVEEQRRIRDIEEADGRATSGRRTAVADRVIALRATGLSVRGISRVLGVDRTTVYRVLRRAA